MIKLRIDNREIEVSEGTTVLKAAAAIGIVIPTMCFMEGYKNHPSCMICLVKDQKKGVLSPSCALPAAEGMDIITMDNEIHEARKQALELLLYDHVGDCEAPCRMGCPAFMDIAQMNRLIAAGKFGEALKLVKEEIALPHILGYICTAPCEKVCRRGQLDEAVSICQLKKYVAAVDSNETKSYLPEKLAISGKKVAVIGSGPAGLSAAFYLTLYGHQCEIFDRNYKAGGSLWKSVREQELPENVLNDEVKIIEDFGAEILKGVEVTEESFKNDLKSRFDAIIIATGEIEDKEKGQFGVKLALNKKGLDVSKDTYETNEPAVFACGGVIKPGILAVRAVAQGKEAAYSVDLYLNGVRVEKKHRMFNSRFGKLEGLEKAEYLKESYDGERLIPQKGKMDGFDAKEAIKEAERCMHCDCRKPTTCKLRQYSDEYRADRRRYLPINRKEITKQFTHDLVIYEPEKCIKCGLCVEIASNNKELTGLTHIGRGFDVKIGVPFNKKLSEALNSTAKLCAEACPTGAISKKHSAT